MVPATVHFQRSIVVSLTNGCLFATPLFQFLDHESLDSILQLPNLRHQIAALIRGDARGNHRPAHTTGTSQRSLAVHINIGDVLVLGKEGQVQEDSEWGGIGGEDDQFGRATVEGFGGFVGAFL